MFRDDIAQDFVRAACNAHGRGLHVRLLEAAIAKNGGRIVSYDDWLTLDAHEKAAAREGAPREKLITVAAMLGVLDGA